MGKKLIIGLITGIAITLVFLSPSMLSNLRDHVHIEAGLRGSENLWTNANFTEAASDPEEHRGDRVELEGLFFNTLSYDNNEGLVGLEIYLGGKDELVGNPLDTSKRILAGYNSTLASSLSYGDCLHLKGHIAGKAMITTMDGHVIEPAYIKVESLETVPCPASG